MDRKAEAQEAARRHRGRALWVYPDDDGMVVIRGRLEPEVGALLLLALEAASDILYRATWKPAAPGPSDPAAPADDPVESASERAPALEAVPSGLSYIGPADHEPTPPRTTRSTWAAVADRPRVSSRSCTRWPEDDRRRLPPADRPPAFPRKRNGSGGGDVSTET